MKILFVNHTSHLTGAPISCFNLMAGLSQKFQPVFATKEDGPIIKLLKNRDIRYYIIREKGPFGMQYIRQFIKICKAEKIDLLHLNTLTPFCKYAAIAGYLLNKPIVWTVREDPLISRSRRLKFWLQCLSSKIIFVDRDTRDKLLGNKLSDKVEFIYNGVDLEIFRPYASDYLYKQFNIDRNERLIGYIGSFTHRKGLTYLIKAFPLIKKSYKKVKLILIGSPSYNDETYFLEIKDLIKQLYIEHEIFFTGMLIDITYALNSLDIVVLPSFDERCSRTLIESLACAKPVVATNVGGTPEIIIDGINGILVEPGNENQIAEAIIKLLYDDSLRQEMGLNGRAHAEKHFNIKDNINKFQNIYSSLIQHATN